jgi:BolA family transcriptional regulator, general stress-responsive regulator
MDSIAIQIEQLLQAHLLPQSLVVIDDSSKHAGHAGARAGGDSHFTVRITSAAFAGKNKVAQHRLVYAVLQPLFDAGLHALALETHAA